jgi:RNA polymerase sigma-70 factor (ECF subfamily)
VATTAALDLVRRRRARPALSLDEEVAPRDEPADSVQPADVRLEAGELSEIVDRAIEEITQSRRLIVRLYLAGYERDEAATLLGWSEAKTRNLLYRGLTELRERLIARGVSAGGAA